MTAGIINMCGAFGGSMSGPNRFNKKGMFENAEIRNKIVKPYLASIECDPLGQNPLPDTDCLMEIPDLREQVEWAFKWQGYRRGPWFYKGAKLCLIWPLWHKAFPNAKWIIVRRADEDIIYSCLRTTFMRAYDDVVGWQFWIDQHKKRFQEMHDAGLDIREVWPTKFVEGDFSEMQQVVEELGLQWDDRAAREFVNPEWWRTRHGS